MSELDELRKRVEKLESNHGKLSLKNELILDILKRLDRIEKKLDALTPSLDVNKIADTVAESIEEDKETILDTTIIRKLSKSYKIDNEIFESHINDISRKISSMNTQLLFVIVIQLITGAILFISLLF